jgi:PKD repeat protein
LNGAASSDSDAGDSITSYTFTFGDGSPAVTQASPNVTHAYAGAHTSYAASLTVTDTHGTSSVPATAVITTVNRPPVAVNDSATTVRNTAVTINVLANDSDPDGDALSVIGVSQPANGQVVVSGNNVIYTPAKSFFGLDTFTYTVSDGFGGTAKATVTVTVTH